MQDVSNPSYEQGHLLWLEQLKRLNNSIQELTATNPCNIIEHFFSRAMSQEFPTESVPFKSSIKRIILLAAKQAVSDNIRSTAAALVAAVYPRTFLSKIRLADIRNLAVFQVYCKCGVTVDTYFERFSSPSGTPDENAEYASIAHGNAVCNAETTRSLSNVLLFMQYTKRLLLVQSYLENNQCKLNTYTLNWMGTMWFAHIKEQNLSLLIWELFLDLYHYRLATTSLR